MQKHLGALGLNTSSTSIDFKCWVLFGFIACYDFKKLLDFLYMQISKEML